jgi:hypothetical protein
MDIVKALFVAHTLFGQETPIHVLAIAISQVQAQYIVVTGLQGMLHDGMDVLASSGVLANAKQADVVDTYSDGKDEENGQ